MSYNPNDYLPKDLKDGPQKVGAVLIAIGVILTVLACAATILPLLA